MGGFLNKKQRKELLVELRRERERRWADRIRVILLLDQGRSARNIADYLFVDEGSVRNYRKSYEEGGIDQLMSDAYAGKCCKLNEEQLVELSQHLQTKIYLGTAAIIRHIEGAYGVSYSAGGITSLLHRLGFSYKKPKGVPGKANRAKQQEFLNRYNAIKAHGKVYFGDSTHPMLNPVLGYGWIKTGEDFEVKTNSGRQRVNINGAVELKSLHIISRSCETVNKNSICDLLRAIRMKNPDDEKIYFILDNAPYNRAKKVRKLAKQLEIRLLYLPPYSPNLNPIERLWKFMKKKVMANHYYEDLETFRAEVMEFFRTIRKHRDELSSLLTDNFRVVGT